MLSGHKLNKNFRERADGRKRPQRTISRYTQGHLLRREAHFESPAQDGEAANSDQLRAAFEKHFDETEGQVERLEQIFEMLGKAARAKKCDAIEGIIDEGKEIMDEYADTQALDAGLLAAAQAVEHYEISRYGTLKAWAAKLNLPQAVKLLDATLAEEKKTDEALSKLAEKAVNYEAAA